MPTPLFSVLTRVHEPDLDALRTAVDSVLAQDLDDWELVLVDDCSSDEAVREALRAYAGRDRRVLVVERDTVGGGARAGADAVTAATGQFLAFLDVEGVLAPDALSAIAAVLEGHDGVDFLYSDEDWIDDDGRCFDRFRKPDWSPERLRGQHYTGHLAVLRAALVRDVGGFREGCDGAEDHDLVLRASERARRVEHIDRVLYHHRADLGAAADGATAEPEPASAGVRVVQEQLDRLGISGRVEPGAAPGHYRIERDLDPGRRVSIIIPTNGKRALIWGLQRDLVVEAVASALAHTAHEDLELVVVADADTPRKVLDDLTDLAGDRLVLVGFDEPFNFSRKMNLGALHASGDRLVFLNDDIEIIADRWVERLVAPLEEPDVGMTGAKLYFANDTVQHAGHAYDRGHYLHPLLGLPRHAAGPFGSLLVNREASGVTAACAAMRRDVFFDLGGFCEELPANFNDVDLSYKTRFSGRRIVWIAGCEAYHFESRTRVRSVERWEREFIVDRWGPPRDDPYLPGP